MLVCNSFHSLIDSYGTLPGAVNFHLNQFDTQITVALLFLLFCPAIQFISQYFGQTDNQGETHPALTLLNQLCSNADSLSLHVSF